MQYHGIVYRDSHRVASLLLLKVHSLQREMHSGRYAKRSTHGGTSALQMVWEQQCPVVIALTKCVEKGRDKCHQYWPDAERMSMAYGDIEVCEWEGE